MRVCVLLGIPTLAEAQERIDADMFGWWQAYLALEPQTLHRLWAGTIAANAINGSMKYSGHWLTADDTFPPPPAARVEEEWDEDAAEALANKFFGDIDARYGAA